MHAVGPLPFGGIGASGIGAYHGLPLSLSLSLVGDENLVGKNTFDVFTRRRAVMRRDDHGLLDAPIRY
jgi:hypothetical protein